MQDSEKQGGSGPQDPTEIASTENLPGAEEVKSQQSGANAIVEQMGHSDGSFSDNRTSHVLGEPGVVGYVDSSEGQTRSENTKQEYDPE